MPWPAASGGHSRAPSMLDATEPSTSSWLVCDAVTKTYGVGAPEPVAVTVIDGQPELSERRKTLQPNDALLLRYDNSVWLIREGAGHGSTPRSVRFCWPWGVRLGDGCRPHDEPSAVRRDTGRAFVDRSGDPRRGDTGGFAGAPGPVGTVVSTRRLGTDDLLRGAPSRHGGVTRSSPRSWRTPTVRHSPFRCWPVCSWPHCLRSTPWMYPGIPMRRSISLTTRRTRRRVGGGRRPTERIGRASRSSRGRRSQSRKTKPTKRWSWSTPNEAPPRPPESFFSP